MPRLFKRRRKWLRRLLKAFCIRHSRSEEQLSLKLEQQLLIQLQELRCFNNRMASSFDDWEEALWLAGLAVVAPRGAAIPVLDICLGFEDYELKKLDNRIYTSYGQTHWDKVISQQGFARLAFEKYPDEPVVDGLPASIWLECVEPTLCILKSISVLKHRKCNLTCKKNLTERVMDSGRSHHGDFMYGPLPPLLALPRRGVIRMEIRVRLRTEAPNLIQGSYNSHPLTRNFNRRHRERQLYQVSQGDDIENRSVDVEEVDPIFDLGANNGILTHGQPVLVNGSEGNTNQNANVQYQSVGSRRPEVLPDIEVVDLENAPDEEVSNSDHVSSRSSSRPITPPFPEWLVYDPLHHAMLLEDVQGVINDVVARVIDRVERLELEEQQEIDSLDYSDDSTSVESSNDEEDEEDGAENERKYGHFFEPRAVPSQDDSSVFYHRGHLVLNSWDLKRENDKCENRPKYIWKESHRVLERKAIRVGPPETDNSLAKSLHDFFSTEPGEWRNSVSGAKLMRLAVKDNYTRRHLMLVLNKVYDQKEKGDPVEFQDVAPVNKVSTVQQWPKYPTARHIPSTRRGRIRMRMRLAWDNLRLRMRTLRSRITGHVLS